MHSSPLWTATYSGKAASNSRGAISLRDSLTSRERHYSKERLVENIESWIGAIKEENPEDAGSRNIREWYRKESELHSYAMPNWGVPPEHSALFREFREDPYYHLKNLVEVVGRTLVEEMLNAEWLGARVYITSDSDDVFGGVDFIVEMRDPKGALQHIGFDLAISDNPDYLEQKEYRTETLCSEFNARKRLKGKRIPRQVFAIPPRIMAGFLSKYMEAVEQGKPPSWSETLSLLEEAKIRDAQEAKTYTQWRVNAILH